MHPPSDDATAPAPSGDPGAVGTPPEADAPVPDDDQPTGIVEAPAAPPLNPGRMRRERDRLMDRRQETLYHLGGLAFELYRRDMLQEGVMRRRAEEVAEIDRSVLAIDEQLATVDQERRDRRLEKREERRVAREEKARAKAPAGHCLSCGVPYGHDANFCLNCGSVILKPEPPAEEADGAAQETGVVEPEGPQETQVIDGEPQADAERPT